MSTIADRIAEDHKREAQHTRRLLEVVPEDKFDWKPHEKSMSLGQLASHIVEIADWVPTMMDDVLDFATLDYTPFKAGSISELISGHDERTEKAVGALDGKDDAFMQRTWTMRMGEKIFMEMPRSDAMRSFTLHHLAHHRGQLTVYLRLLGAEVPPTYGPTADHQNMMG